MAESAETEFQKGSRVQVVVRVRPVLPHEIDSEVSVACAPDGSKVTVTVPNRNGVGPSNGARAYKFDACLPGSTTQVDLFETCGMQELVEAALDGYSVTVFAFGQTGSGKTHTIVGPRLSRATDPTASGHGTAASASIAADPNDGLLPRCIQAAFDSIDQRKAEAEFSVTATCTELYNESVTDLLGKDSTKQLQVRKDARDGFQVEGLHAASCPTAQAAMKHMQKALMLRHTRSHRLNEYSSRSHCMMTFTFASKETSAVDGADGDGDGQHGVQGGIRRYGKLVLVDLAGSERLKETGNTSRDAVRETGCINKSLFTLGQVLASLSAKSGGNVGRGMQPRAFVPYRDSKLTQLLWEGLRGTGRALMLACLGPTKTFAEESLNTLHFASMALRIKAAPVVLIDPQDKLVIELRSTIKQLQVENRTLAVSLQQLSTGAELSSVIDSLPERLRTIAVLPPGTAPPLENGGASPTWRKLHPDGTAGYGSGSPSSSSPSYPWMTASMGDVFSLQTPKSSSVLRLSPMSGPSSPFRSTGGSSPWRWGGGSGSGFGGGGINHHRRSVSPQVPFDTSTLLLPNLLKTAVKHQGRVSCSSSGFRVSPGGGVSGGHNSSSSRFNNTFNGANNLGPARGAPSWANTGIGGGVGPTTFSQPALDDTPLELDPLEFPELAALEEQFQQAMLTGGRSNRGDSMASSALAATTVATVPSSSGAGQNPRDLHGAGSAVGEATGRTAAVQGGGASTKSSAAVVPVAGDADTDAEDTPDVRALKWARRNKWFGEDMDMTEFAYKVHDILVDAEHIDASSDVYYMELELRVAAKFPERWAKLQKEQKAAATAKLPPPATSTAAHAFGRALKVSVKDALPAASASAMVHGFMNYNAPPGGDSAAVRSSGPASGASMSGKRKATGGRKNSKHRISDSALLSSGAPGSRSSRHLSPSSLLPSSDQGSRLSSAASSAEPGSRSGFKSSAAPVGSPASLIKQIRLAADMPNSSFEPLSYEQMQQEYTRQRAAVLDELNRAKALAEVERARIMAKIGKSLGNSRWRS